VPYQSSHRSYSERGSRARTQRANDANASATQSELSAPHSEQFATEPDQSAPPPQPAEDALAGFALLAAPSAIAGETTRPESPEDSDSPSPSSASASPQDPERSSDAEEVERLRAALHLRSQEIEALRERWAPEAPSVSPAEATDAVVTQTAEPPSSGHLLDAAAARRLAADARAREQASRAALEAAQRAHAAEIGIPAENPVASAPASKDQTETQAEASPTPLEGWQRRPLVSRDDSPSPVAPTAPIRARAATAEPTPPALSPKDETVRRLTAELAIARAEKREAESRVTLATKKTASQRLEIEALRTQLTQSETKPETRTSTPQPEEHVAGSERVAALEAELELGRNERRRLEQAIADGRETLSARNERLAALEDRLEAQDRALDAARREYELERQRHTRSLELLDQLRSALSTGGLTSEVTSFDRPQRDASVAPEAAYAAPEASARAASTAPRVLIPKEDAETNAIVAGITPEKTPLPEIAHDESRGEFAADAEAVSRDLTGPPNAALFDRWLDDQVRRHFGPMGIDAFSDLLRAPLERESSTRAERRSILLLGHSAWQYVGHFVESLLEAGPTEFVVHVADPSGDAGDRESPLSIDSPLRDLIETVAFPTSPDDLDQLIAVLKPTAIVSRDFLSQIAAPATWMPIFEAATERNCALLFAERTGSITAAQRAELAQSSEMSEIGERIWARMPARYTQVPNASTRFESFATAFEHAPSGLDNQLFETLRGTFQLELSAQFGFLVEPFLSSPIAAHFEAQAPRDQRFLQQVSDLDDRKIEAGVAPGLHFVGLVDPQSEA